MSVRIIQDAYGGPDVLRSVPVERPSAAPGDLVVRVHAAAINPVDAKTRAGGGIASMIDGGFPIALGWDAAGVVAEVGDGVTEFQIGDRVYGMPLFPRLAGTFSTYVAAPSEHWAPSPSTVDDVTAAAVPMAALTALQALRDIADVRPGQRVLVLAAGGGVGHFAVQLARHLGADVLATASPEKAAFVKDLGAEEVVDYRSQDVAEALAGRPVDVVIDLVGGATSQHTVPVVAPGGLLISVPGGVSHELASAAAAAGIRAAGVFVSPSGADLRELAGLIDSGSLRVTVSQTYPLADIAAAHEALDGGHALGKVVVKIP